MPIHSKKKLVTLYVNKKPLKMSVDVPLSLALYANSIYSFYRSLKFSRPRGLRYLEWWGSERICIDGNHPVNPNMVLVKEGLHLNILSSSLSLSSIKWFFRKFFSVGFYNNPLIRNRIGWWIFIKFLNRFLPYPPPPKKPNTTISYPNFREINTDVLVIGGGLSGLMVATTTAKYGLKTVLIEANDYLGGYLANFDNLYLKGLGFSKNILDNLIKDAYKDNVKILLNTVFQGFLEDVSIGLNIKTNETYLFNYKIVVIATGKKDNYAVYENNDLPRSMSLSTALKMLNRYGMKPGSKGVIIGVNDVVLRSLGEFKKKNINIKLVCNKFPNYLKSKIGELELEVELFDNIRRIVALGKDKVKGLKFFSSDGSNWRFDIDFVAFSPILTPDLEVSAQLNLPLAFDIRLGGLVPLHNLEGKTILDDVYLAGSSAGVLPIELEYDLAKMIGLYIGSSYGKNISDENYDDYLYKIVGDLRRSYPDLYDSYNSLVIAFKNGARHSHVDFNIINSIFEGDYSSMFVCPDTDVTMADIIKVVKELDMWRMEHIKRYSGLGTGRCQGRDCILNTIIIVSKLSKKDPLEIGRFRARYPVIPHNLLSLAGVKQ